MAIPFSKVSASFAERFVVYALVIFTFAMLTNVHMRLMSECLSVASAVRKAREDKEESREMIDSYFCRGGSIEMSTRHKCTQHQQKIKEWFLVAVIREYLILRAGCRGAYCGGTAWIVAMGLIGVSAYFLVQPTISRKVEAFKEKHAAML